MDLKRRWNKHREWKICSCVFTLLLGDYVKECYQTACRTCSTIIFPHSTNQIIVFWRRLCRYRRPCWAPYWGRNSYRTREIFLNFPIRPRLGILAVEPTGNPSIPGTPASPSRPKGPWKQELTNSSLGTSTTQISTVIGNSLAVHAVRIINQEKYSTELRMPLSWRWNSKFGTWFLKGNTLKQ